jgi:hypothetical protein
LQQFGFAHGEGAASASQKVGVLHHLHGGVGVAHVKRPFIGAPHG